MIKCRIYNKRFLFLLLGILTSNLYSQDPFSTDSTIISIFEEEDEVKRLDLLILYAYEIKFKNINQSIHLFKYAYKNANKLGLKEREIYCAYHLAENYYDLSNYFNAIKYYKIHGELAAQMNDTAQIANSYYHLGLSYFKLKDFENCENSYLKAIEYYSILKETSVIGNCYNNLGLIYARENYDKALIYYKKAYNTNKQIQRIWDYCINLNNIACLHLYKGEVEKVKPILDSALLIATELDYKHALSLIYGSYGEYYQAIKEYKSAEENYLHAIKIYKKTDYLQDNEEILELIVKFYEEIGDYPKAYRYYKEYIRNKDSLQKINNEKLFLQQEHQEEIRRFELKSEEQLSIQKKKEDRYQRLIILISGLLMIALGFFYVTRIVNRKKIKLQLENQELKDNLYIEKIENKNKELVSKTMLLGERNDLIKDVSEKLISCRPNLKKANVEIIQGIIDDLNSNLNEKQWEDFQNNFQNLYPNFYSNLLKEFPDLSSNELRLCSFLRLNMSSKEIAQITYVATNSVEVARSRIRKKFGLTNPSSSLQAFLARF